MVFLTDSVGAPGQPHAEESSWTMTSDHTQKLTQNRSKTSMSRAKMIQLLEKNYRY